MQGAVKSNIGHEAKVFHSRMHSFIEELPSSCYVTNTRLDIRDEKG